MFVEILAGTVVELDGNSVYVREREERRRGRRGGMGFGNGYVKVESDRDMKGR